MRTVIHNYINAHISALWTSARSYLRHLPYIQFASRSGFTPLILTEKVGEEMAVGNPREVEKVGKWVRELRPRRRQLPLRHLGLPPESSTSPSFLSVVWRWQLVRDLGEACTLALAFLYCPTLVCENVSQNWNSTLERSLWSSDVKLWEWSSLRCKLLYPSRLLTDVLGLFYSRQVQVSNFPLDFLTLIHFKHF